MRRTALLLVLGLLLVACGGGVASEDLQGAVVDPPKPKPDFVLTDTSGDPYDFGQVTEGRATLLYFGYLNCPDICPVHLAQIAEVFDQVPSVARDTEVVFVTVDPERDQPDAIREYLDRFDPRFVGLTGTLEEVQAAQQAAGVPLAQFVGEGDDYTVDHAAWVIAFGPDNMNHALYPFGVRQSDWLNDLQILVDL